MSVVIVCSALNLPIRPIPAEMWELRVIWRLGPRFHSQCQNYVNFRLVIALGSMKAKLKN